ncbi:hypothetical protein V5O48_003943 [Marasmius crinis-equi]|uniref:Uncharacterized protein n=1 Tax=Marasmius crinis-equi TaxID=585013 RepID=A0ABR3FRF3_9AGAR
MDLVFSESFCQQYPDVFAQMQQIIIENSATDLVRSQRGPDILPNQKTIVWDISSGAVRFSPPTAAVEKAGVIWVEAAEMEELVLEVMVGNSLSGDGAEGDGSFWLSWALKIAWLEMRHRVHVMTCKKIESALEEVFRFSLGQLLINERIYRDEPILVSIYVFRSSGFEIDDSDSIVQADSPVATNKHRAKYLSLLLRRIEGLSASQAKWIVATYPTWGALCDAMLTPMAELPDQQVRRALDGMPDFVLVRLRWMAKEYGTFLRRLDRDP